MKPLKRRTRAQRVIRFIEQKLRIPEGDHIGKKVVLEKFQKDFIIDVYDNPHGTKMAILSMARKNAKTALIAMLVIVHLVGPEAKHNSRIISGAMSKEQAAEVFNYAVKMINMSEELIPHISITPSKKTMTGLPMNVTYKAVAADGKTNMGGSPILAILDEVGQIEGPQNDFVDSVTTSQGAYDDALLIAISTQASTDSDLLSIWIDDALESEDPQIVCHLHTTPLEVLDTDPNRDPNKPMRKVSILEEEFWQMSNPALGIFRSLSDLRAQAKKASRMPSSENKFRNLCLNQRVSAQSAFIAKSIWQACGTPLVPIEQCTAVYGGLDLSKRTDLSALVLYGLYEGRWYVYPYFWTPLEGLQERSETDKVPYNVWVEKGYITATPGATIDYEFIAQKLVEVFELPNLEAIAYDRWRMDVLKSKLIDMGLEDVDELPLVPWGQGFKDMSPAMEAIEEHVVKGNVSHNDNPVLNLHAHNVQVAEDAHGNRKPVKAKATKRIDGFVALAMAAGIAERQHEANGNFDDFLDDALVT